MNEKKNNSTAILIIIVVILLFLTTGYILYKTIWNIPNNEVDNAHPSEEENKNETPKIEEISINDKLVKNLYEMSHYYNGTSCIGNSFYHLKYLKNIGDIILTKDLSDKDKLNLASKLCAGSKIINEDLSETYLSENQIVDGLVKVFGKNYVFDKLNTKGNMGCGQYEYVLEKQKFVATYACGNVCYPPGEHVLSQLIKANKIEETIEIYELIGYDAVEETQQGGEFTSKLYKDEERKQLVDDNFEEHELIIKFLNQLPQYKYIFKKDTTTGNYYFYGIERVN